MSLRPTYLLGVDGATWRVLDALMADGLMPNLAEFAASGVRADLLSTANPLTPPAWTTLMTGQSPGHHGIFDFIWAEQRGSQVFFTLNDFRDIRCETVWSMVSRSGGTVTSLNFPLMAPPPKLDGTIVPGLVSWKHLRRNVQPPDVWSELSALPGFDPRHVAWDFEREKRATKHIPESDRSEWVRFHTLREQSWMQIYRHVTRERPADLTALLLDGVDKLQHVVWSSLDPDHRPQAPTQVERELRSLTEDYFRALDRFLGELVQRAGPTAHVLIASDHGFRATEHVFRLNKWLEERGYLRFRSEQSLDAAQRRKVARLVQEHFVHLDWNHTCAYSGSSASNGIWIRIREECPDGGGIPRSEYETFRERLIEELLALRDPESGIQIVTGVARREDAFPGPHHERAPDLTLTLHDHGFISTLDLEPIFFRRPEVSGTHRPEGVLLARGPGIRRGEQLACQSIVDVTPTLLYSLGLPVPEDLEGRVMEGLFTPEWLESHPRASGPRSLDVSPSEATGDAVSEDEERAVLERLRALGYVE